MWVESTFPPRVAGLSLLAAGVHAIRSPDVYRAAGTLKLKVTLPIPDQRDSGASFAWTSPDPSVAIAVASDKTREAGLPRSRRWSALARPSGP